MLRTMHVTDLPAAAALLAATLRELGREGIAEEVTSTLEVAAGVRGVPLVAVHGVVLVGALFAELERGGSTAFVRWLVVAPTHRRRGIASALVDALEATAGVTRIHGLVDRTDPAARRFWRSRGWTPTHARPRRELLGVDVLRGVARAAPVTEDLRF